MDVEKISAKKIFLHIRENNLLIAISISINVCALALPIYTLQAYDRIIMHQNFSTFFILTTGALFFIVLEFVFRILRSYLTSYCSNANRHREFIKAVIQFAKIDPGRLLKINLAEKTDVISELDKTNDFIYKQLYIGIVDVAFLFLFLVVIALLSAKLAIAITTGLMIFTVVSIGINFSIIKRYKTRKKSDENRLSGIINFIRANFIAKTYANELLLLQKQDLIERKAVINTRKLSFSLSLLYNFSTFTTQLLIVVTLIIGVLQIIAGALTFGTLIATVLLVGRLTNPIREMLTIWFRIANFLNSNKKLTKFYKENTRSYLKGNLKTHTKSLLDISNLGVKEGFNSSQFAVESLNITLSAGDCAAITDINGQQRSLLKKLFTGAIKPDSGDIYVSGNPLHKLTSDQYHKMVGYITIEEQFINGTIKENITGGRDIPDEVVEELCQMFEIKNDIIQLENGFQTNINSHALQELPMIFRIKILLVRSYIYRPKVVVVDTNEEYIDEELYQTLFKFLKLIRNKTAILIITNDCNFKMLASFYYKMDERCFCNSDINKMLQIGAIK